MIKEIGYGARSLMKLHTEINQPERIKTLRQPLIREYMVRTKDKQVPEIEEEPGQHIHKGNKGSKRGRNKSKYVNPDSDSSDSEPAVIRFPPHPKSIVSKYIKVVGNGKDGEVVYWEWKAG